jgi:flagellar motor switch protein FliM
MKMNTHELFKNISLNQSYLEDEIEKSQNFSISSLQQNLFLWVDVGVQFQIESFNELLRFQLGEVIRVNKDRLRILINKKNIEEIIVMENDIFENYGLCVDVSVGNIEMSLSDVISIEKGDFLISKLPVSKFVKLMIGGEVIANASFSFDNDEIILKVNETFMREDELINDNKQE